jgi:hypothetical protein
MRALVAMFAVALPAAVVHSDVSSTSGEIVRRYFQALDHQDFDKAIALTDGCARTRTSSMIDRLRKEAAVHKVTVEIRIKHLDVRAPGLLEPRGVPVPVAFDIEIVSKKWCFSRIALRLSGQARFYVDPARPDDRIVAIDGSLVE